MEITNIIIIIILIFIAYRLSQLTDVYLQNQRTKGEKPLKLNPALYPLFSEEVINLKREQYDFWQKSWESCFEDLQKTERQEVKNHDKLGKGKSLFEPSKELENIIAEETLCIFATNNSKKDYQKMIESNIAILNGKSISEVEDVYYEERSKRSKGVPYENTDILFDAEIWVIPSGLNSELEETYKESLKTRKEFWHDSWDYILNEDKDK